jgi:heme/copper-type cytochrome/quinol oxidase subunit 2
VPKAIWLFQQQEKALQKLFSNPGRKQSQSGWDITTKIFAALTFLFAALLVVLTICLLKLRRRVVTSPSDVDTYELNAA